MPNPFFGTIPRSSSLGDPTIPIAQLLKPYPEYTAFSVAPQFTLGTASRNPVRGPSYRNVDVAVSRRIPLAAGSALELRGEIFNLLNTPALGAPNGVLGSAGFGTITTAGDPRVIQLAAKVLF